MHRGATAATSDGAAARKIQAPSRPGGARQARLVLLAALPTGGATRAPGTRPEPDCRAEACAPGLTIGPPSTTTNCRAPRAPCAPSLLQNNTHHALPVAQNLPLPRVPPSTSTKAIHYWPQHVAFFAFLHAFSPPYKTCRARSRLGLAPSVTRGFFWSTPGAHGGSRSLVGCPSRSNRAEPRASPYASRPRSPIVTRGNAFPAQPGGQNTLPPAPPRALLELQADIGKIAAHRRHRLKHPRLNGSPPTLPRAPPRATGRVYGCPICNAKHPLGTMPHNSTPART